MNVAALQPEWQRLDLLGRCLDAARRGTPVADELKERLRSAQQAVARARTCAPWQALARRCELEAMDQDILACVTAPDAEPQLGWLFQDLQPALASAYPSPALIRELLFMGTDEAAAFHGRLAETAPLRRHRLIEPVPADPYRPLHPTARARAGLLGWPVDGALAIPGALEVPVRAGWDDLVLPAPALRQLREFLLWVAGRERVEREWGARPWGGPAALFCGPSGTGKSLAAEVMASALGWRLFRVDLGLLVSKYIGETEKNLNALFDAAEGEPVLLLFDEADALFGRRGEVKDARDRYANMEVGHLLTRLERHRGPSVLTTNLRSHIDPAFTRRFQAVVEFPRPDAAAREALWRRHLPPRAPCSTALDLAQVAQAVALTGGQIRNAALQAALLAAAAGAPIGPAEVARGIWVELCKDGRELTPASLGALAPWLEGEGA
ncbi:MAG: ATP-binding protein [Rubrivivax sp.]